MKQNKKELSNEILNLIENFESNFGENFDIEEAISCNRDIPINALKSFEKQYDNFESTDDKYTFAILKPNAVKGNQVNSIIGDIKIAGLNVIAAKKVLFVESVARSFYKEHEGKDFFDGLVDFLSSGPSYILVLEKEDGGAIKAFRDLMGPVAAVNDPDRYPNTLRANYAHSMTENSVHGSDSYESFIKEVNIAFFGKL